MLENIEKTDALIALQIQEECVKTEQELADEQLAKQIQEEEIFFEDFVCHQPPAVQQKLDILNSRELELEQVG